MEAENYNKWILKELEKAIDEEAIELRFQPKVSTKTRDLAGFEVLSRWTHPKVGIIPAGMFINLAEDSSLIHKLGEYVVGKTLEQLHQWDRIGFDYKNVSINVSSKQIAMVDFYEAYTRLRAQMDELGLDPKKITLEITERVRVDFNTLSIKHLERLHDTGLTISIDDFGAGYSSLAYLAELPVDEMKLDRTLISNLTESSRVETLVGHIFAMAKDLGLSVVVEGVETEEQAQLLETMFDGQLQGHLFNFPLLAEEVLTEYGTETS